MNASRRFYLELIEPRIIRVCLAEGIEIELEDAKAMISAAVDLAKGDDYVTVFDARKHGTISKEAREEFAVSPKRIGAAVLVDSLSNRLMGNFFIQFHKPLFPTRVFSDEASALVWLRVILNNHSTAS